MAENKSTIMILVTAFMLVILGASLITIIANNTNAVTNPTTVTNESLSIASLRIAGNNINQSLNVTLTNAGLRDAGGWVDNSVSIKNASGFTIGTNNYTVDYTNDRISFLNTTYMVSGGGIGNNTLASYQYYANDYVNQSWQRSVLNLISGFFALALIGAGLWLFYSTMKEYM